MKKIATFLAAASMTLVLSGAAHALTVANNWTLDLSTYDAGKYTNINYMNIDGQSTVIQKFTSPYNLANGDTFSESGRFFFNSYRDESNKRLLMTDLGSKSLYIDIAGLTGSVYNVTGTAFDYKFNPGVGSIKMYLDTDDDLENGGAILLASLNLTAPSGGHNNGLPLGGAGINGTTDLTGLFSSIVPGVFSVGGVDFNTFPQSFGLANTNNLIASQTIIGADSASLVFDSGGQFNTAVPEPGTMVLLGAGLFGLAIFSRRKINK